MAKSKKAKAQKKERRRKRLEKTRDFVPGETLQALVASLEHDAREEGHELRWDKPAVKMSEVIMEFANPVLRKTSSDDEKELVLAIAIGAWNLALLPEEEHGRRMQELVVRLAGADQAIGNDQLREMIQWSVERKKRRYFNIRRYVLGFEFVDRGGDYRLNVMSTPLDEAEDIAT